MPYSPGWSMKQIDQYRAIKQSVAAKHPDMDDDDVQAFAAKVVNTRKATRIKSRVGT